MKYDIGDIVLTKSLYFIRNRSIGIIVEVFDPNIITGLYRIILAGQENKDYWLTDDDIDYKIYP